jgi:hypothetical protein
MQIAALTIPADIAKRRQHMYDIGTAYDSYRLTTGAILISGLPDGYDAGAVRDAVLHVAAAMRLDLLFDHFEETLQANQYRYLHESDGTFSVMVKLQQPTYFSFWGSNGNHKLAFTFLRYRGEQLYVQPMTAATSMSLETTPALLSGRNLPTHSAGIGIVISMFYDFLSQQATDGLRLLWRIVVKNSRSKHKSYREVVLLLSLEPEFMGIGPLIKAALGLTEQRTFTTIKWRGIALFVQSTVIAMPVRPTPDNCMDNVYTTVIHNLREAAVTPLLMDLAYIWPGVLNILTAGILRHMAPSSAEIFTEALPSLIVVSSQAIDIGTLWHSSRHVVNDPMTPPNANSGRTRPPGFNSLVADRGAGEDKTSAAKGRTGGRTVPPPSPIQRSFAQVARASPILNPDERIRAVQLDISALRSHETTYLQRFEQLEVTVNGLSQQNVLLQEQLEAYRLQSREDLAEAQARTDERLTQEAHRREELGRQVVSI